MGLKIALIGAASPQWGFTPMRICSHDGRGAHPAAVSPLPGLLQEHLALHARIVEDVVEASISGDRQRMLGALERDPLLENVDRGRIPEMWDRLAAANRE